jgi:ribosomal protein S18 acetylase RimI-like enzyme
MFASVEIVRMESGQVGEASAMLARAFQDDPAWQWVLPDATKRAALLPWLFRVNFEVTEAQAWVTPGEVAGCARWLPPGRPQIHVGAMLRALVATPIRVREATSRFLSYGRAVEAMRGEFVPEPHWYLAGIGVDPARRREGIATALMQPGFDASVADRNPCALLTNNEDNVRFYAGRGFEVVGEGPTPDGGPHAWMMRRAAPSRLSE